MRPIRLAAVLVLVIAGLSSSAHALVDRPGVGNGMELVADVPYDNGMHLMVTRSKGRDYAIASAAHGGVAGAGAIRFFDVTKPAKPKLVATIPCGGNQAFMQITHDGKTLVVGEDSPHPGSPCMRADDMGFFTIDISNPRKPRPLGSASVERGGHTVTTHPTKALVYVSYGDVFPLPTQPAEFEVWSLEKPAKPKHVSTVPVTGYHGPHDIGFNAKGTYAVSASMSLIHVLDTSDPKNPVEVEVGQCPGCSHNHEAHFTPDQKHVVISDEASGGAASPCPLGALYFYRWNPEGTSHMELVGEWQPAEVATPEGARTNAPLCTSHVFDISRDGTKIAASWHNAGVRVVDITTMTGVGVGPHGPGARELGWYVDEGADSWSAKFDRTGRYVFVNDLNSGFQVYRLAR